MRPIIFLIILSALCYTTVSAQSLSPTILSTAGDVSKTDHLQLEWTLGELAVESMTSRPHSYTEGFHQPLLIVTPAEQNTANDTKEQEAWNSNVLIAPNPVATTLKVQFKNEPERDFQLLLLNPEGQCIQHQIILPGQWQKEIDLSSLPAGMYYLNIQSDDGQIHHSYKISKIQ